MIVRGLTEKELSEKKAREEQERINQEARARLAETDWYVVRFLETGKAIPEDLLAERQRLREAVR